MPNRLTCEFDNEERQSSSIFLSYLVIWRKKLRDYSSSSKHCQEFETIYGFVLQFSAAAAIFKWSNWVKQAAHLPSLCDMCLVNIFCLSCLDRIHTLHYLLWTLYLAPYKKEGLTFLILFKWQKTTLRGIKSMKRQFCRVWPRRRLLMKWFLLGAIS